MADAVADFRAEVDSSRSDREGYEQARVLVNEAQIVFVTEDTERTVQLAGVFDLSQGIAKGADTSGEHSITIAFRDGEVREAVSLRAEGDTLANFQIVLFKLLFDGTTVTLQLDDGSDGFNRTSLNVTGSAVAFEAESDGVSIAHDDVAGFETTDKALTDAESQPVAHLYWADETYDAKTTVVLPTFRTLNLFGRYLQSYTVPARVTATQGWIQVLFVDDDPHDLEMAELMLAEEEPDFSIETANGAEAGHERLAEEEPVHCLISDYDMPGTDGIEFLQQVRDRHPDLPFILFTGQGSEAVAKQALLSDVTDYVEKGIGSKQYEILAERVKKTIA